MYKGKVFSDVLVAVKILNNLKENGEEFINEVATITRIHLVNVFHLVGFCADGVNRALIYEFLPNESSENALYSGYLSLFYYLIYKFRQRHLSLDDDIKEFLQNHKNL